MVAKDALSELHEGEHAAWFTEVSAMGQIADTSRLGPRKISLLLGQICLSAGL